MIAGKQTALANAPDNPLGKPLGAGWPQAGANPALPETSTRAALTQAVARLSIAPSAKATGDRATEAARRDAGLLLRHVTGRSRTELLTHPERPLSSAELEAFYQAVERRAAAEPIQYITGVQEFYGLAFNVTPAVLIPRPETEHLIEQALALAKRSSATRIVDVGTGSGAIAVTLAHLLPHARLLATDISSSALAVAQQNAQRHGVADRVAFALCDLLPPGERGFDLICSNPPYVSNGELLETQVAAFEPHSALFAGPDGLDVYRRLIPLAAASLRPGGWLLLEIGYGQQPAVASLLEASHLQNVAFVPDLQAIPRVALARKAEG